MPSVGTISDKRQALFQALGSDSVWDKRSITTIIFALFDAIAKEFGNFQDGVDTAKANLRLTTITSGDSLQQRWGDMLQENVQGDISIDQNINVWRSLLKRFVYGVDLLGVRYRQTTKNNVLQTILDYSLVAECVVFEFWNNKASFVGAGTDSDSLVYNSPAHAWNQGANSSWLDIGTLRALAYMATGFQVFPVISSYTRDTALIEYAARLLMPFHNLVGFCWMCDLGNMPIGTAMQAVYIQLGVGDGSGPGCASPIATVVASTTGVDAHRRVVQGNTASKRSLGVVSAAVFGAAAEVTEMCLLDASMTPIAGTYRVVPAIHKQAGDPVAVGFYYTES